jgi:hypothetical protein
MLQKNLAFIYEINNHVKSLSSLEYTDTFLMDTLYPLPNKSSLANKRSDDKRMIDGEPREILHFSF